MREIVSPLDGIQSPFGQRRGGTPAWSPASLFASGERGAIYEPGPTSCFTDTAGTIPAGVGDAVARMNDLSGNGNHAPQSSAPARGVLQSGFIDVDGVDDWFVVPAAAFDGATSFTVIARIQQNPGAAGNDVFIGHRVGSSQFFDMRATTGVNYNATFRQTLFNTLNGTTVPSTTTPETVAYTFNADGSQSLRVNGTQQASSGAGTAGPGPVASSDLGLGAYFDRGTPILFFSGRLHKFLLRAPALSLAEIEKVETYFNG